MNVWRSRLLVGAGYLLLALVYAWPLPLHLAEQAVLARGSDFYPHIWNVWWTRFSLVELGQNPYTTDYLYHPSGLSLVYHVLDPLNGILSIPLQAAFGLLAAFNLLRIAQLIFSALAAYALARLLGLPRWAAWLSGTLYTTCPVAAVSFDLGQLVEISTGWIPLYTLCLMRGVGNTALGITPGKWGWLVGAGAALAAAFLTTPYFFIALLIFTVLYVGWELISLWQTGRSSEAEGHPRALRSLLAQTILRAGLAAGLSLLLLSPLIVAILRTRDEVGDLSSPLRTVVANSADLVSPFLPAPARLAFPEVNPHGGTAALGWGVLLLGILGLVFGTRSTQNQVESANSVGTNAKSEKPPRSVLAFWLAVAAVFALLALGPRLIVAGNQTDVPMPFALLSQVPLLGTARVPLRFVLMSSLAFSMLAGFGLLALWGLSFSRGAKTALTVTVALLLTFELIGVPRTMFAPEAHPFWQSVRAQGYSGREGAVLELPQGPRTAAAMYNATLHQRPIVAGYTARHFPYPWLDATPGIAQLVRATPGELQATDIVSPSLSLSALPALSYYDVRYIALYKTSQPDLDERARETVELILGPADVQPVFAGTELTVWEVPQQVEQAGAPLVGLGAGWLGVEGEGTAGDRRWRWTDGNASVQLTNMDSTPREAVIRLSPYTFSGTSTLSIEIDGNPLASAEVGPHPPRPVELVVTLPPGEHWLRLRSSTPPARPPGDSRLISIGYERVEAAWR
jgi:hypothetical protein